MIRTPALAFLLAAAACGDNKPGRLADPALDAGPVDAGSGLHAIVVSGNFMAGQTGVMSALDLDAMQVAQRVAPNSAVGSDPMFRKFGNELVVVNRTDGNNVTILDATTFRVKEQLATGAGSNPQDVAMVGDKLFVPGFDTAGVVVLTRGSSTPATIDLGALDLDGHPNCASAYAIGNDVYVSCGLLDMNFQPRGPGKVVVIDAATNLVKTTITMASVNPIGAIERLPNDGDLVIPTANFANLSDGCVERIKVGAAPAANGCLVTNAALHGFAARIAFQQSVMLMVVANGLFAPNNRASLQGFDLGTSMLWPAPLTPMTQLLVDVAVCPNDLVVVADSAMATNGLRIYDGGAEKTTAPLEIGLKPGSNHGLACY